MLTKSNPGRRYRQSWRRRRRLATIEADVTCWLYIREAYSWLTHRPSSAIECAQPCDVVDDDKNVNENNVCFHFRYNRALVWDEEAQRESPEWWRNLVARCSHKNRTTSRNNFRWRDEQWDENKDNRGVRKILVRGSMPPCSLRWRKFWKFAYERVHSGVYLNKYVVSIAPFSTSACPDCSQSIQKTALFSCFRFLFIIHFSGGSADPICPYVRAPMIDKTPVRNKNQR